MRTLLCALLAAAPAVAQTVIPLDRTPKPVHAKPVPAPLLLSSAADDVRVEFRVLTVSGKEGRAAVAKLFKAKGKEPRAFLSEADLKAVLEKCAADPTTNVMQAPRIAAPAGQAATVAVCETQAFTTSLTTKVVDGQVVFLPQNEAVETGTTFTATATPSDDGRFVELKLSYHDKRVKADVPLFPVTTFVMPAGGKGEPIPFTQFVQVPEFTELSAKVKAVVPDGGTVAVHAGTRTVVTKIESKVPVLGDVPYLNRLFRNTGVREEECDVVVFATATRVKATAAVEPPAVMPAAAVLPRPDAGVAKLVAAYHKACAAGKTDEAMRLAVQALAKDPTCFGK